jgi:hypothetical protein
MKSSLATSPLTSERTFVEWSKKIRAHPSNPCHPCTHLGLLDVCYTLAEQIEQVLLLLKAKVQNRLRHQGNGPVKRVIG